MTAIIFSCMALTIMVIIAGAVFVTRKLIAKEQVQAQIDAEQSKGNVANVNEATEDGMVSEDFYDLKDVELIQFLKCFDCTEMILGNFFPIMQIFLNQR